MNRVAEISATYFDFGKQPSTFTQAAKNIINSQNSNDDPAG